MTELVVKVVLAYLLGSVMGSLLMGRLTGTGDLRTEGSGNAGATNALRTRGTGFAVAVLVIDALKGLAAVLLIPIIGWPLEDAGAVSTRVIALACGVAVTLGHVYPIFYGFNGGKGAATLLGVFLGTIPAAVPWGLLAFAVVLTATGYAGLATLCAALVLLFYVACFTAVGVFSVLGAFSVAMLVLVVITHRDNIRRLATGTENRFERAMIWHRLLHRSRTQP